MQEPDQNTNQLQAKVGSLYTTQAEEFSKTRTAPWTGWIELVNRGFVNKSDSYKVLDLGCGNGRFFKFAQENTKSFEYLGLDYSNLLLSQAKNLGAKVLKVDLDNQNWVLLQKDFDLVVAFGIQHHLSNYQNRLYFLNQISESLSHSGVAVVTYWQFLNYDRYQKKIKKLEQENDFLMSFGSTENARFCHFTNLQEIEKLESESNLTLIDSFNADCRDNTENIYRVYKKR